MRKSIVLLAVIMVMLSWLSASGTRAGDSVFSPSVNLTIEYSSGSGGLTTSKNAADFGIADTAMNVLEINGLVETNLSLAGLSGLNLVGGLYKAVVPGTDYVMKFSYLNRGNNDEVVSFSSTVTDVDWSGAAEVTTNLLEDATHVFTVTMNAGVNLVENLEKATFNILTRLVDPDNVVSYNAFTAAVGAIGDTGTYGGTDNITHQYSFEIEGYNMEFSKRDVAVNSPTAYGYPADHPTDVVPGSKIRYDIVFRNNSKAIAKDVILRDKIPNNCHLYYTETPAVDGATASAWEGETNNNADSTTVDAVKFRVTVPAESTVTASYSVTID